MTALATTAGQAARVLHDTRRAHAAALWRGLPPGAFSLALFINACGSKGCALGWLAQRGHDGWGWRGALPAWDGGDLSWESGDPDPYGDAALYFGLVDGAAARALFSTLATADPGAATADAVARALLAAPYCVPREENR